MAGNDSKSPKINSASDFIAGFKNLSIVGFSLFVMGASVYGIWSAFHSSLFVVQDVKITGSWGESKKENPLPPGILRNPLPIEKIREQMDIPVGRANLIDIRLSSLEKKILKNSWVKTVALQKKFPNTLTAAIQYRRPIGVFQNKAGDLAYLDEDAQVFGEFDFTVTSDLPMVHGIESSDRSRLKEVTLLIRSWHSGFVAKVAELSSVHWNSTEGYRILVTYPFLQTGKGDDLMRVAKIWVSVGQNFDESLAETFPNLAQVIQYLQKKSIAVSQVSITEKKKIVVRASTPS